MVHVNSIALRRVFVEVFLCKCSVCKEHSKQQQRFVDMKYRGFARSDLYLILRHSKLKDQEVFRNVSSLQENSIE